MNKQLQWKSMFGWYCVAYAHKGDLLFTINAKKKIREEESYSFSIIAPNDSWYILQERRINYDDIVYTDYQNYSGYYRFSSLEEWEDYYLLKKKGCTYTIEDDLFEGTKMVKWKYHKDICPLGIEANELGFFLSYSWSRKWRNRNDLVKLKKYNSSTMYCVHIRIPREK